MNGQLMEDPTEKPSDRKDNLRPLVKRAVIYLRVSTAKQVGKDDDPDGYSLPAQEESCRRKAGQLDAEVVDVFVDRGESAKTQISGNRSAVSL